jgi:hypothetical protein
MRFYALVQTGPGAHPAYHTMDIGSFLAVEQPGHGINYPAPASSAEVKERVDLYSTPLLCLHGRLHSKLYMTY